MSAVLRRFAIGAFLIFTSTSTSATTIAAETSATGPKTLVSPVYSTAFLTSGTPPWTDLRLRELVPSPRLVDLVLPRPGAYGMIDLRCRTLSAAGRLGDCVISVEPKGLGYEAVGEQAARELQVDPEQARELRPKLKFLSIQVRTSNTAGVALNGPCWPPRCNYIPAPPPPPPSPEPPPSPKF